MKILFAFGAFLLGAAMGITPSARGDPGDKGLVEIQSCKDFVANTFEGTMIFTKAITCAKPKVVQIETELTVRSLGAIETKGVHFIVRKGGLLTFAGDGVIKIERHAEYIWPVILLSGEVSFEAGGWTPSHPDGGLEDKRTLVLIKEGGTMKIPQHSTIRYTTHSFSVAKEPNSNQEMDGRGRMDATKHDDERKALLSATREAAYTTKNNDGTTMAREGIDVKTATSAAVDKSKDAAHSSCSSPSSGGGGGKNPAALSPVDFLGAGKPLAGALRSKYGSSAVWPGSDGSLMFGTLQVESSDELGTTNETPPSSVYSELIPSNKKKLERVLGLRNLVENGQGGDKDDEGVKDRVMAWLPWRRRLKRDLERARTHHGEVEMSVDRRGGVEVTVDGSPVLSKSGPHAWEWRNKFPWRRRKDDGYEMVATDVGMEIRLDEKRIWGVTADELMN